MSYQEERNYEIKMGEQELGRRGGSRSKVDLDLFFLYKKSYSAFSEQLMEFKFR